MWKHKNHIVVLKALNYLKKKVNIKIVASGHFNDHRNPHHSTKIMNYINSHNLNYYKNSLLLIENHEFLVSDNKKIDEFFNHLNQNFEVEKIENSSRNPYQFSFMDKFSDDERWLLMSEGREQNMNWLLCTPKDRTELFDKTNI